MAFAVSRWGCCCNEQAEKMSAGEDARPTSLVWFRARVPNARREQWPNRYRTPAWAEQRHRLVAQALLRLVQLRRNTAAARGHLLSTHSATGLPLRRPDQRH